MERSRMAGWVRVVVVLAALALVFCDLSARPGLTPAQAGFFSKAKDGAKDKNDQKDKSATSSVVSKGGDKGSGGMSIGGFLRGTSGGSSSSADRPSGSFFGGAKSTPGTSASTRKPTESSGGFFFGGAKSTPGISANTRKPTESSGGFFFGGAKNKPDTSVNTRKPTESSGGFFFGGANNKPDTSVNTRKPTESSGGFFFGGAKNKPGTSGGSSSTWSSSSGGDKPAGGFFGGVKTRPGVSGGDSDSRGGTYTPSTRTRGTTWTGGSGGVFGHTGGPVWRPGTAGSTGGDWRPHERRGGAGYFAEIHRLKERHRDRYYDHFPRTVDWWFWWYPYDLRYYQWHYGYCDPFAPDYAFLFVYGGGAFGAVYAPYYIYHPVVVPAVIVIAQSNDDDYYESRVRGALGDAVRDLELGWRDENLDRVMRHVDYDGEIRVYYGNTFSHTMTGREFQDLTRDAFENTRTESMHLDSVTPLADGWAKAKGRHVFYDPNGDRRDVYVYYLLQEVGGSHPEWIVREIGQGPEPY